MRHQEFYDYLKSKNPEDLSEFQRDLLRDWGDPDIFGPWTEIEENSHWDPSVGFKFYKSYYLVDFGSEQAVIDSWTGDFDQSPKKESLKEKLHNEWKKLGEIFKNKENE
jgi:hypothetical protein